MHVSDLWFAFVLATITLLLVNLSIVQRSGSANIASLAKSRDTIPSMSNKAFMAGSSSCLASMPPIGLGTMALDGADTVKKAIKSAIAMGYRRIDCAPVYFNEEHIGDVLASEMAAGTVKREELFVTSKLACPFHRGEHVEPALRKTLSDLRLDYLDLFLIHWPVSFKYVDIKSSSASRGWIEESIDDSDGGKNIDPSISVHETWGAMERLVDVGLVRSIGVSNFPVSLLHELLSKSRIPPSVNQVEMHPYLQQPKLLAYCRARGVHVQAYSALGTTGYKGKGEPSVLEDPTLKDIAAKKGATVAQLCLAWALRRGTSVVAKSAAAERQLENIQSEGLVELSDEDMEQIAAIDKKYRFFRPEDWWGSMSMAVFD